MPIQTQEEMPEGHYPMRGSEKLLAVVAVHLRMFGIVTIAGVRIGILEGPSKYSSGHRATTHYPVEHSLSLSTCMVGKYGHTQDLLVAPPVCRTGRCPLA